MYNAFNNKRKINMATTATGPDRQFMPVGPGGNLRLSDTDEVLYPALRGQGAKCESRLLKRSFECRERLFKCCGTEGPGSRPSICPWVCKACCIKNTADCYSNCATFARGLFTCGYLGYQDCKGCLRDRDVLKGRVAPSN